MDTKKKFDKIAYNSQYSNEHYQRITLRLRPEADKAVIERLKSVPNMTDYIRQLVISDIERNSK